LFLASGAESSKELVAPRFTKGMVTAKQMVEIFDGVSTVDAQSRGLRVVSICDFSGGDNIMAQFYEFDMS
jgi:hypothetical protein